MEYRILGPLEVIHPISGPIRIEGAKARGLLVLLLLSRNSLLSLDRLADELWSGSPPPSAVATIHAYVSRLRRALAGGDGDQPTPLVTRRPGYLLEVAAGECDTDRFEQLVRRSADARPEQASALLGQALAMWRGPALVEFVDLASAALEADRLTELRLVATERRAEAELARHHHGQLVPELERLVADNPLRESLTGLLMTALYRAGRQSDALRAYQVTYRRLAEEIGVMPGPALRALETAILNHDPSLTPPVPADVAATPPRRVPLPPAVVRLRDRMPLNGRTAELSALREAWSRLGASDCRIVAVNRAGGASIASSRLVAELAHGLHADGTAVLWGRCLPHQLVPYQPFVEALGDHLAAHGRQSSGLARAAGRALSWLLPDLPHDATANVSSEPSEPGARRYLMFEASATLLCELLGPAGLMLVLEDLHLADPSALCMVEHLVQSARRGPMALVVTMDDAAGDALPELLAGLDRDGLVARIELRDGADVTRAPDAAMAPPVLDSDLAEVLGAASLVGAEFDTDLLARMLDRPASELGMVLDRAVKAHLLDERTVRVGGGSPAPRRLRFDQVVYDSVGASVPGKKATQLRQRLVNSLATESDRTDRYALLAQHVALMAHSDARRSVEYSRRAGDYALERLGFIEAAHHYQDGLNTLSRVLGDVRQTRCELLLGLATARRALYQRNSTQDAFQDAAELAIELGDPALIIRSAWGLLSTSEFTATIPATVEVFQRGLASLEPGDSRVRVALTAGLAKALPPGPQVPILGREAIEMARRMDDPEAVLIALGAGVLSTWAPDNVEERIAFSSEVIATGHELGWVAIAHEARVWRSAGAEELGDLAAADADLDAVRTWANASRQPFFLGLLDLRSAARALFQGRYAEAERLATAAVRGIDAGPDFHAGYAAQLFGLRRDQGRLAEIDAMLTELVAGSPHVPAWRAARVVADIELGRPESARSIVDLFAAEDFDSLPRDWLWLSAVGHLADCCADLALLGMPVPPQSSQRLYNMLEPYAQRCIVLAHGVLCTGVAARQLGGLSTALGRYDEAAQHFEAAIAMNRNLGAVSWAARAQLGYASALLRRGDPGDLDHAAALLDEAELAAEAIGAHGLSWRSRLVADQLAAASSAV